MHDLVLVGGGHAHVEVVRRWRLDPPPHARLTLVLDAPAAVYSGMVPGFVAGQYARPEIEIDVEALGRAAGARTIVVAAHAIDPAARRLRLADGSALGWDTLSLDVGAGVAGADVPGVREHALPTRPIGRFVARVDGVIARAEARRRLRAVVVGAGAGGVELAFALDARARRAALGDVGVTVVDGSPRVLPGYASAAARRVEREARARGIVLRLGRRVAAVDADQVRLEDGARLEADLVAWVTGASPPSLLHGTTLPTDARGFVRVRATLQCVDHDHVFAAGDCASVAGAPDLPKAGVYAVRQAPALDANLRARVAGRPLRAWRPQRAFLSLLNLGDGRAIGVKWGMAVAGRPVFRLKDWIDRRFVARYAR